MKKFFSFVAAALTSTAMFAVEPAVVPSAAEFNAYKAEGANVVVGFYTEAEVCNDIVFVGSYNGWATGDVAALAHFEAMEGFEKWYVVSVTDASESIEGKPVQLKSDGSFAWDYQIGDDLVLVSGTATIEPGYSGEVNVKALGTDAPVVLASGMWKQGNNPCVTVPTHDYTIILDAPFCADAEGNYFDPAIIGAFNGWGEGVAMTLIEEGDNVGKYTYTFNDEEKHEYKFKAVGDTDWTNQIQLYNAEDDTWSDNPNLVLGTEETIYVDYSDGRYTLCVEAEPVEAIENVAVAGKAVKAIVNGELILTKNGVVYNILGARK